MGREAESIGKGVENMMDLSEDICGYCGEKGAEKYAHLIYWPNEQRPGTEFVHRHCEQEECERAHAELSDKERKQFLTSI